MAMTSRKTAIFLYRLRLYCLVGLTLIIGACTSYYMTSSLNQMAPGQTKAQLLQYFATRSCPGMATCYGMTIRAARVQPDGALVEVGTVNLATDGITSTS